MEGIRLLQVRVCSLRCRYNGYNNRARIVPAKNCIFCFRQNEKKVFGFRFTADSMPDLLCGPVFSDLPTNMIEKATVLQEAEEPRRISYKLAEDILSVKSVRGNSWREHKIAVHILL